MARLSLLSPNAAFASHIGNSCSSRHDALPPRLPMLLLILMPPLMLPPFFHAYASLSLSPLRHAAIFAMLLLMLPDVVFFHCRLC